MMLRVIARWPRGHSVYTRRSVVTDPEDAGCKPLSEGRSQRGFHLVCVEGDLNNSTFSQAAGDSDVKSVCLCCSDPVCAFLCFLMSHIDLRVTAADRCSLCRPSDVPARVLQSPLIDNDDAAHHVRDRSSEVRFHFIC